MTFECEWNIWNLFQIMGTVEFHAKGLENIFNWYHRRKISKSKKRVAIQIEEAYGTPNRSRKETLHVVL